MTENSATIFAINSSFSLIILFILFLVGLSSLEKINLSFTVVSDSGLRKLCGISSLKSLNLDAYQITDAGLATLTSMCSYEIFTIQRMVCLFLFFYMSCSPWSHIVADYLNPQCVSMFGKNIIFSRIFLKFI